MGFLNTERNRHRYEYISLFISIWCNPFADNKCPVYRVNTFPLIHLNLLHTIFNIFALAPLLERFETEFGTLTSLALFFGRQYILGWRGYMKNIYIKIGADKSTSQR